MKKICIVTTRHISYNPRVLKEADALFEAGYDVTVVGINNNERQAAFDEELMRVRKWKLRVVRFGKERRGEKAYWVFLSLKQRLFLLLAKFSFRGGVAERAAEKAYDGLRRLASAERADLYIAHHAESLGAAYAAARRNNARFGFDAEDFHTGMNEPGAAPDKLIEWIEAKYLPACRYLTAASKGIGEAYRDKYGVRLPLVILNVFPLEALSVRTPGNPIKFYWYSQVIGPNRGIELLLDAASRIDLPFEIHLRGKLYSDDYLTALKRRYAKPALWERIFVHEPILAAELIRDGNQFDVGLALEPNSSINNNLAVANKIFSYLMSRLFIIGTDTYGQKEIFGHFPDAVRICRTNDPEDLANAMRYCLSGDSPVVEGKKAAGEAVEQRFNWGRESVRLRQEVDSILKS
jgi:glycosyltransferase involved in cell wall biosynthesis